MFKKKSPVTLPGIDPGTFRLVAQHLNDPRPYFINVENINFFDKDMRNILTATQPPKQFLLFPCEFLFSLRSKA